MRHRSNNQKEGDIFRPGYEFKVAHFDLESDETKKLIRECVRLQEECLQRKEITQEVLNKTYDL